MKLFLTNTLSRAKEPFAPQRPGEVTLYTCGPTVHDHAHIGNFRTFVFYDLLRRTLKRLGLRVRHVVNLTDVEDRIIAKAQARGVTLRDFTAEYVAAFEAGCRALRIEPVEHQPRATDHIPEIVALVGELERRGHTYAADGTVWFRIASFPGYGRLSRLDLSRQRSTERVASDAFDKQEAHDFALWKGAKPGEPSWDSPWGPGRPGWHIECSAMAMRYLGPTLDLHAGGVDLIFPHHENEIAQSEAATGQPFARYWLHPEHLHIGGEKMSKRLGNFSTVHDLLTRGVDPRALRYSFLGTHYRKQMSFSEESLDRSASALERIDNLRRRLASEVGAGPANPLLAGEIARAREAFDAALGDDLNAPEALAALHGLVGAANAALDRGEASRPDAEAVEAALADFDSVLAILPDGQAEAPAELLALVRDREAARARRDWAESDRLRARAAEMGWLLEDVRGGGTRWRRR